MNLIGILIALTLLVLFFIGVGILFDVLARKWAIPGWVKAIAGIIAAMILLLLLWQVFSGAVVLPGLQLN